MADSDTTAASTDLRQRAARIRVACFDVDGTLTDGRLYFDGNGQEMKAFHARDGQGLKLLGTIGITVAFVTARASPSAELRAAELGVEAHTGIADKLQCVRAIADRHGAAMRDVAFMGDDLADLEVIGHVGLSVAPADAHHWVGDRVHWRTRASGGQGAARELCDLLLQAQGKVESILAARQPVVISQ